MNQKSSALVRSKNLSNQKEFLSRENLICKEHLLARKYWVDELKNFICELDDPQMYEMIHFRQVLDRSSNELKAIYDNQLLDQTNCVTLDNLLLSCNQNFEQISNLSNDFNGHLTNFSNEFINEFHIFLNKNEEITKLKDLILSFKFDNKSERVDYGGIRKLQEHEMDFLQLAKIIISRDFLDLKNISIDEMRKNLLFFLGVYSDYLLKIESKSEEFFSKISNMLIQELCKFDGINYDKEYFSKKSPIIKREELERVLIALSEQIKIDANLNIKIHDLENEIFINESKYKNYIETLKFELEEKNKKLENSLTLIEIEKNNKENLVNENNLIKKNLEENIILSKEKSGQITYLNNEIEILKQKDYDHLTHSENKNVELITITEKYESALKILENKLEEQNKLINSKTTENFELKNQLIEEKQNHIDLLNDESSNLKQFYEKKINFLEKNFEENNKKFEEIKNKQADLINENLNELENQTKKISDLNYEITLVNNKLLEKSILVEDLEKEKLKFLEIEENFNEYKINLETQIKQNEFLVIRLEELERRLALKENENNSNSENEKRYNDLKLKFDKISEAKNLIENEIIEKRNNYAVLKANVEDLNLQNKQLTDENVILKEQSKISQRIKESINNLSSNLEQSNNLNAKYEIENLELSNKINYLNSEISELRKIVEIKEEKLKRLKYESENKKVFEEKYNILQESKQEIEKVKSKMELEKENIFAKSLKKISNSMVQNENDKSNLSNSNNNISMNSTNRNLNNSLRKNLSERKVNSKSYKKYEYETDRKVNKNYDTRKNYCNSNTNINSNAGRKNEKGNLFTFTEQKNNRAKSLGNFSKNDSSNNNSKFLMNHEHIQTIKSWLSPFSTGNSEDLTFNLLLKASKDGYQSEVFKKRCHKKPFTLVVALTSFNKLIGGFTSLPWSEDDFTYVTDFTKRTFLFSLTNNKKFDLKNPGYAICNGTDIGPIFGGGSDLEIVNECNKRYNNFSGIGHTFDFNENVEDFYGGSKYLIKDYEVYEVKF